MTAAMPTETDEVWECVHTVNNFYDRPILGVADFHGMSCAYSPTWDDETEENSEVYELSPIDPDQLRAVMESWEIWMRWERARRRGTLGPEDAHPTLAVDKKRYEELKDAVDQALSIDHSIARRAIPTFRPQAYEGFEVKWEDVDQ